MENPENKNLDSQQKGGMADQLGKLRDSGALVLKQEEAALMPTVADSGKDTVSHKKSPGFYKDKKIFGDIVSETIKNIDNKVPSENRERNHQGNGRQADRPALAEKVAEIQNTEEQEKKYRSQLEREKALAINEVNEIKTRIKEAEGSAEPGAVKNWEIRLKNAEDVLMAVEKGATYADPVSGKAILGELHEYRRVRNLQAQAELKDAHSSVETEGTKDESLMELPEETNKVNPVEKLEQATEQQPKLNNGAIELLKNVDTGGVPAFMTRNLRRVAEESGLNVSKTDTPNSVIERLRALSDTGTRETSANEKSAAPSTNMNIEKEAGATTRVSIDNWQDEAIANFEKNGGKVLGDALENTPEVPEVASPVLTEVADDSAIPVLTESVEVPVGTPHEGQEEAFVKFKALIETGAKKESAEERKERMLSAIYKYHNVELPERAKKAGMPEKMLEVLRAGGAVYNELPLKTKLAVSLTLFGAAWIAGGTIASIAIGGSVTQRALGGMATFVAAEGALKASAEKGGRERGEWEKRRHTAEALIAGFLVGGGALGHAIQNVLHEGATTHTVTGQTSEGVITHPSPEYVGVAEAGDSRWSIAEKALMEGPYKDQFSQITSGEQRVYIIDALKDKITAGMTASEANTLNIGEKIDFKEIFADKNFMDNAFSGAHNLTPEGIANIHNYEGAATVPEASTAPAEVPEIPKVDVTPVETAPSVAPEVGTTNATIEAGALKGSFNYSPTGAVESFSFSGTLEYPQTMEPQKLLSDNWRATVLGHGTAGGLSMDIGVINGRALNVSTYDQMLKVLEQRGAGTSPEAEFLRKSIENTVASTEKTYGDVFKNIGDFNKPEQIIGAGVVQPEVLPGASQGVLGGGYEISTNPQSIADAEKQVSGIIKNIWGKEGGWFGFGSSDGMNVFNSFADRTVDDVAGMDAAGTNKEVQDLLSRTYEQTHIKSAPGEKVMDYLQRATALNIDASLKNK